MPWSPKGFKRQLADLRRLEGNVPEESLRSRKRLLAHEFPYASYVLWAAFSWHGRLIIEPFFRDWPLVFELEETILEVELRPLDENRISAWARVRPWPYRQLMYTELSRHNRFSVYFYDSYRDAVKQLGSPWHLQPRTLLEEFM